MITIQQILLALTNLSVACLTKLISQISGYSKLLGMQMKFEAAEQACPQLVNYRTSQIKILVTHYIAQAVLPAKYCCCSGRFVISRTDKFTSLNANENNCLSNYSADSQENCHVSRFKCHQSQSIGLFSLFLANTHMFCHQSEFILFMTTNCYSAHRAHQVLHCWLLRQQKFLQN